MILSGNSIEHGLLALAAMYARCSLCPDRAVLFAARPRIHDAAGAVGVAERLAWSSPRTAHSSSARCRSVARPDDLIVTCSTPTVSPNARLAGTGGDGADRRRRRRARARRSGHRREDALHVGFDRRAQGVINTQRMLCSNQEMMRTVLPLLADEPPVLCDWLPWNHTFGGNHNFGLVLFNGGTLYIDEGSRRRTRSTRTDREPARDCDHRLLQRAARLRSARAAPVGRRRRFARHFFSRLKMLFCAAAALRQQVADELIRISRRGARAVTRIPFVTGLGATESAPIALCAGDAAFTGGRIGVPAPGVELKLAPVGGPDGRPTARSEHHARLLARIPSSDREPRSTRRATTSSATRCAFFDPERSVAGICVPGAHLGGFQALHRDVGAGSVRFGEAALAHFGDLVYDVVIAGHDREFVGALVFPNLATCRELAGIPGDVFSPDGFVDAPGCPRAIRGALLSRSRRCIRQLDGRRARDSARGAAGDRRAGDDREGQRQPEGRARRAAPRSLRSSTVMTAPAS